MSHALIQNKKLVCFDFDGTLVSSNSLQQLYLFKIHYYGWVRGILWRVLFLIQIPVFFLLYQLNPAKFNQFLYSRYRGMQQDKLLAILQDKVLPFLWRNLYPQADTLLREHKANNTDVIIISASWNPVVQALATLVSAKACYATELQVKNGKLTGLILDYVDKQRKAECLRDFIAKSQECYQSISVYGNSTLDIPMLELADSAHVINPSKRLRLWAHNNNAAIHYWQHPKTHWTLTFFSLVLNHYYRSIQGWHHIPKEKGCIIIANHASHLDQYMLYPLLGRYTRRRPKYLAKKEHFRSPLFARIIRYMGAYPVDRQRGGRAAILQAIKLLNEGHAVVIFPEGTRTRTGQINEFKSGVVLIHEKTAAPIVPVGLSGTYQAWPYDKKYPKKGDVDLVVGELIDSLSMESEHATNQASKTVKAAKLHSVVSELVEHC
ncbi:HAD-IB family hydrolase [Saccharobesus litoralis]|uniref:HAD-IB family hydrolase n=1 Tax=Saccharobesus litoralis TaxID=2172099 RepID=A0A2S0VM40_9ALTE|nr:HAD-IB family hydrolase [Saccharobesus litoralis]AWB65276.1 HAD-IB family hydrolase [Saccharobesus litoralis]